jgi:hypothetical protein
MIMNPSLINSFRPETALFRNLCVNRPICLCGVKHYASAQIVEFLDLAKNLFVSKSKTALVPSGVSGWSLNSFAIMPTLQPDGNSEVESLL